MQILHTDTPIRLIGIPYAGGSRYSFNELKPFLGSQIQFETLELPGRGKRVMEPLLKRVDEMVDDLYRQIEPLIKGEYVLFGHSMGGTLGNLLIHKIKSLGKTPPLFFLVTGCAAPKFKKYDLIMHKLETTKFKAELKNLGGLPDAILASDELMDFFLPIIKADMGALENHAHQDLGKYDVPLVVIAGTEEKMDEDQLQGWELETSEPIEILRLSGNHFFILNHFKEITNILQKKLAVVSV